jgi:uncharacterized protein (TIGR03435 family)
VAFLSAIALAAAAAFGQTASRPGFEVASVKMYAPDASVPPGAQGFSMSPDGIRAVHVTIRGCLQWAYNIVDVSGPSWITQESYDITAKASGPVPAGRLQLMMQALLEDRFDLKVHRETRRSPVGVLFVSKGGVKNLPPIASAGPPEMKREAGKLEFKNAPMSRVAAILRSPFGNMPLEPMADETGLSGVYDLTLDLRSFDPKAPEFAGKYQEMRDALFAFVSESLERSYGLKLERRMMPQERLVVDSGNKVPAAN